MTKLKRKPAPIAAASYGIAYVEDIVTFDQIDAALGLGLRGQELLDHLAREVYKAGRRVGDGPRQPTPRIDKDDVVAVRPTMTRETPNPDCQMARDIMFRQTFPWRDGTTFLRQIEET